MLTCYMIIVNSKSIQSNERSTNQKTQATRGCEIASQPPDTAATHYSVPANICTNQSMGLPSVADPRANWLLHIYITCMQTEMLIFTGGRFLRGQLAVHNWNAYYPVHD